MLFFIQKSTIPSLKYCNFSVQKKHEYAKSFHFSVHSLNSINRPTKIRLNVSIVENTLIVSIPREKCSNPNHLANFHSILPKTKKKKEKIITTRLISPLNEGRGSISCNQAFIKPACNSISR